MVLLAAAPVDRLFVHTGGEDERDRQLLDDLGLSGVKTTTTKADDTLKLKPLSSIRNDFFFPRMTVWIKTNEHIVAVL